MMDKFFSGKKVVSKGLMFSVGSSFLNFLVPAFNQTTIPAD
jgi:hypothetical protein